MANRDEVFRAIDSERIYQTKWDKCESDGKHELGAWILFMQDYLAEARVLITRGATEKTALDTLHTIREVIALGVACMEQHGAPTRRDEEDGN